jgi:Tfp pilus assembly protein PilE
MSSKIASAAGKFIYDIVVWMIAVAILNTLTKIVTKSWTFIRSKTASRKAKLAPAK